MRRRINCSSIANSLQCPKFEPDNLSLPGDAAIKGGIIHAAAEAMFYQQPLPKEATPDMIEVAESYMSKLRAIQADYCRDGVSCRIYVEMGVHVPIDGISTGIIDAAIVTPHSIKVIDLKTGQQEVSPVRNKTMMLYCLGLARLFKLQPSFRFSIGIYQPSISGDIQWWDTTVAELLELKTEIEIMLETLDSDKPVPSKACMYCKHQLSCRTPEDGLEQLSPDNADVVISSYKRLPDLTRWMHRVEATMKQLVSQGVNTGYKFVAGRLGQRKWTDDAMAALQAFADSNDIPLDKLMTQELHSPAKIEVLLGKKAMLELGKYIVRNPTASRLVPMTCSADDFLTEE